MQNISQLFYFSTNHHCSFPKAKLPNDHERIQRIRRLCPRRRIRRQHQHHCSRRRRWQREGPPGPSSAPGPTTGRRRRCCCCCCCCLHGIGHAEQAELRRGPIGGAAAADADADADAATATAAATGRRQQRLVLLDGRHGQRRGRIRRHGLLDGCRAGPGSGRQQLLRHVGSRAGPGSGCFVGVLVGSLWLLLGRCVSDGR